MPVPGPVPLVQEQEQELELVLEPGRALEPLPVFQELSDSRQRERILLSAIMKVTRLKSSSSTCHLLPIKIVHDHNFNTIYIQQCQEKTWPNLFGRGCFAFPPEALQRMLALVKSGCARHTLWHSAREGECCVRDATIAVACFSFIVTSIAFS